MNIVEKVDFLSKLSQIDANKIGAIQAQNVNTYVERFDPPSTQKLQNLQLTLTNTNQGEFMTNLPNYLQQSLDLYENAFAYDSDSRSNIVDFVGKAAMMLKAWQGNKPDKRILLFFTDALAINDPALVKKMLGLIEESINQLVRDSSSALNGAILALLDPLGDSFEVTTCIRANHDVRNQLYSTFD